MSKPKWNYAVMRSAFGDLWVGKTKLSTKKDRIFANITDAIYRAEMLFEDAHFDFDADDEDNNDMDLQEQYESIVFASEDEVEEIGKEMGKFIV